MTYKTRSDKHDEPGEWYEILRAKTPKHAAICWRDDSDCSTIPIEESILVQVTDGTLVWRFWTSGELVPHYTALRAERAVYTPEELLVHDAYTKGKESK